VNDWSRDFKSESNAVSRTSTVIVREGWSWRAQLISLLSNVSSWLADGQTDAGRACQTRRRLMYFRACILPRYIIIEQPRNVRCWAWLKAYSRWVSDKGQHGYLQSSDRGPSVGINPSPELIQHTKVLSPTLHTSISRTTTTSQHERSNQTNALTQRSCSHCHWCWSTRRRHWQWQSFRNSARRSRLRCCMHRPQS